ncbi:hypothetical protein [Marinicrinis lubricantis]|uniref:Uncharacterized protein n=1 Tax=Marinicrinis lubricantis TaxID=2086470 RepID=A0ABW1ILG0_9BACL
MLRGEINHHVVEPYVKRRMPGSVKGWLYDVGPYRAFVPSLDGKLIYGECPSLLLGQREELRFGEKAGGRLAKALFVLLVGKLRRYRPITAQNAAASMVASAQRKKQGVHVYESDEMTRMGQGSRLHR